MAAATIIEASLVDLCKLVACRSSDALPIAVIKKEIFLSLGWREVLD